MEALIPSPADCEVLPIIKFLNAQSIAATNSSSALPGLWPHTVRRSTHLLQEVGWEVLCIFGCKGASTSQVIGTRNEMMMDDYDGQMIFGDLMGLKLPDTCLTGEENPRKNLTQETCPDWGSNPDPLRDKSACHHLLHSGGPGRCLIIIHPIAQTSRPVIFIFSYISRNSFLLTLSVFRMKERRMWVSQWFQSQTADFHDNWYKSWYHSMVNVSIPEVNIIKIAQHLLYLLQ